MLQGCCPRSIWTDEAQKPAVHLARRRACMSAQTNLLVAWCWWSRHLPACHCSYSMIHRTRTDRPRREPPCMNLGTSDLSGCRTLTIAWLHACESALILVACEPCPQTSTPRLDVPTIGDDLGRGDGQTAQVIQVATIRCLEEVI